MVDVILLVVTFFEYARARRQVRGVGRKNGRGKRPERVDNVDGPALFVFGPVFVEAFFNVPDGAGLGTPLLNLHRRMWTGGRG